MPQKAAPWVKINIGKGPLVSSLILVQIRWCESLVQTSNSTAREGRASRRRLRGQPSRPVGVFEHKGQPGHRHDDDAQIEELEPEQLGRQANAGQSEAYPKDHTATASMSTIEGSTPGAERRRQA